MPTALLICMENTFWNSRNGNFVKSFKKSFKLYIDSGLRKRAEAEIDILGIEQGGGPLTEDFSAMLYNFVIQHLLRKIHCFYLHLIHLTTFFPKY